MNKLDLNNIINKVDIPMTKRDRETTPLLQFSFRCP